MRLSGLPLRGRLVAGFVVAMLIVLVGAGAFVFWRVQFALDHRLDEDLRTQTRDLLEAAARNPPRTAIAGLRDEGREAQLLSADGGVLAFGSGVEGGRPLLTSQQARCAQREEVRTVKGYLFSKRGQHLRVLAAPVRGTGPTAVAVSAVRLDQRDEALRELLVQLALANLLALLLASAVGYRLAHAALDPVERYRAQAEQIAQGATGVRLEVSRGPADEVSRLGTTLNAMLEAQERASMRQQQFIDDASHELRTPLTTLAAEIDLALRKPRTAAQHEATLHRLATDTAQLVDLAETLLTLGALGSATPEAKDLPAKDLLAPAAGRARSQLNGQHSREVRTKGTQDLTIHADPAMLQRALGNLVDNAVRYGDGTITLAATKPGGHCTVLTVHDEGLGMPRDFLGHAAERFRQDEFSRTGPGAGLGLSLVVAIITAHHGQVRICSAGNHHHQPTPDSALPHVPCTHPEEGTTISLLLPRSLASSTSR